MNKSTLHLIIPTYGRVSNVNSRIGKYVFLLNEFEHLKISYIDNCSDQSIEQYCFEKFPHPRLDIMYNSQNIGGVENIKKALRNSDADWAWVVPDDATILEGGLRVFFENQLSQYDYILTTAQSPLNNSEVSSIGFLHSEKYDGEYLYAASWLGSNIFKTTLISRCYEDIEVGGGLSFPHLGIVFRYMKDRNTALPIPIIANAILISNDIESRYKWLSGAFIQYLKLYELFFGSYARAEHLTDLLNSGEIKKTIYKTMPYQADSVRTCDLLLFLDKANLITYGIFVMAVLCKYIATPSLNFIILSTDKLNIKYFRRFSVFDRMRSNVIKFNKMSDKF